MPNDPTPVENAAQGWVFPETDGHWAYGVSFYGEPAQGGFAATQREAVEGLGALCEQLGIREGMIEVTYG